MLSLESNLETTGPALHLWGVDGLTPQVFLPLFLSQGQPGQPDHGLLGPLAIGPVSTFAAPSRAVITSCRLCLDLQPGMCFLSRVGLGGMLSACCFRGLVCPVTDAVGLSPSPGSGPAHRPFTVRAAFPVRRREPCARAGQCLSLLPDPSPPGTRVRTWCRAQGSLSD